MDDPPVGHHPVQRVPDLGSDGVLPPHDVLSGFCADMDVILPDLGGYDPPPPAWRPGLTTMTDELTFRVILIALFIPLMGTRYYYAWRVSSPGDGILVRLGLSAGGGNREGNLSSALISFFGSLAVTAALVYGIMPGWIEWGAVPMAAWLRWIGVGLSAGTVPLLIWVHYALDKNWSVGVVIRSGHTLVSSGPYRWVRHPMYTAVHVWGAGFFLLSANLVVGLLFFATAAVAAARAGREEASLIEQFGDQYVAYMERTGRFLPRLRTAFRSNQL